MKQNKNILKVWEKWKKIKTKSDRIVAESKKLEIEGNKLWKRGITFKRKRNEIIEKEYMIRQECFNILLEAIQREHGNDIEIEAKPDGIYLSNGEVYKYA